MVVLSRAVEKNFALEAEVSRLRHHVSVVSRRLHLVTLERDGLVDMVAPTMFVGEGWGETPPTDEEVAGEEEGGEATPSMAESVCPRVAMEEVAEEVAEEEVAEEEVAEEMAVEKAALSVAGASDVKEADDAVAEEAVDVDVWMERRLVRDGRRQEKRMARREENTAGGKGVERVPEMAEGCNRFKLDLVVGVESPLPDPMVKVRIKELEDETLVLVRQRRQLREEAEIGEAELRRGLEDRLMSMGREVSRMVSSGD